ncbi:MAG: hypothetical protein HY565_04975 [Candidatus Kerfeldbacteria bacterium]|nr:hypothetical protein [Candidatus Kerfeldbacteria bacterium]
MASVQISDQLLADLEHIVKDSKEFKDVSAYAGYILEQVVAKKKQATPAAASHATYSKEDEDKIKERLKNLGYLD